MERYKRKLTFSALRGDRRVEGGSVGGAQEPRNAMRVGESA